MKREGESRMATPTFRLRLGDCVEVLLAFDEGSVDVFVCDPPYG